MKLPLNTDVSMPDNGAMQPPTKVCMHVLGQAVTDARVMRAATALVEAGFEISIVDVECLRRLPAEEKIRGIRVKHIVAPDWYTSRRFKPWFLIQVVLMLVRGTFRLLLTPADIYHAHDTSALPTTYIAARIRRKPLIFDAHELPLADEMKYPHWRGLLTLFSRLLAIMMPRCAGVITVSPFIAQELQSRYHLSEVSLVRNILEYRVAPKNKRLGQHLEFNTGVRIALYQGILHPNRGLNNLVRAARFLEPDIVIVILGAESDPILTELEVLVSSEGVANRVKILPPVPYTELLEWTTSADIGLIVNPPNYSLNAQMCLPNKLFEYLMAGLPVLVSPLDAVSDIVRTYDVGHVLSSLAPEDIARGINTMLADSVAYARMRRNALKAAKQDLCWEKESQQLIHLYHQILATRNVEH